MWRLARCEVVVVAVDVVLEAVVVVVGSVVVEVVVLPCGAHRKWLSWSL